MAFKTPVGENRLYLLIKIYFPGIGGIRNEKNQKDQPTKKFIFVSLEHKYHI